MNKTSKYKMFNPTLPRVEDLEKSPEWTSLTNEINDLEKMCHLNNHRPSRRQPVKYSYHRHSMPQMQKATSVWIEPNDDHDESYRWSWRPKTEFERSYFFDDYSQDMENPNEYQKPEDSRLSNRSRSSVKFDLTFDRNEAYSGTRERLHEIFERNRYLRRKFFASMPDESTRYDFPKGFEQKNPSHASKYNSSGFGSTETLTSQSNQSSISSSNDRKSRCQLNITPELVDEEHQVISNRSRTKNDRDKLLNISSANDVYLLKGSNFYDTVSKENSGSSGCVMPERSYNFRKNVKTDVDAEECASNFNHQFYSSELERNLWHENRRNDGLVSKPTYGSVENFFEFKPITRANKSCLTLINDQNLKSKCATRNSRNLCKSLPNLNVYESKTFAEESKPKNENVSREKLPGLTLRRVKLTKVPAPLDLSRVNERYEEVEALERKLLSNYTVDVSLLRNYDCPLQGLPTIIQDECPSDDNEARYEIYREDSKQRGKKDNVPGLPTVDELQSPQLVNNYKGTQCGTTNLQRNSQVAEFERRAPLSNHQANSIGGLQAGTGTTLPSVYGPIPYSQ